MSNSNESSGAGTPPGVPDLEFVARQLRKPYGDFAAKIAEKMDQVNKPLFDLAVETMQLTDGESVLEIGFGSGRFFKELISGAPGLQVCGIDYSPEMVRSAHTENQSLVKSGQLRLESGSSDHLPFSDHTFDKVFCNMVIFFWDQPAPHLREIHRVLKSGGRFYTGIRARESMLQFPFTRFGFNLYGREEWESVLREHGFKVVQTRESMDPPIEDDGKLIQLQSLCIVAQK